MIMKKINLVLFFLFIGVLTFSFVKSEKSISVSIHKLKGYTPSGISGGYAGAPNEANCTQCHSGSTQSGDGVNTLTLSQNGSNVSDYVPDQVYMVSLSTSASNVTRGFQAVVMNTSNQVVGSVSEIANECVQVTSGRVTHNQSNNTSCNSEWRWEWTAPSTDEGELTFYVSTLVGNGSFTSGDQVYLSQYTFGGVLGLDEDRLTSKNSFKASYISDKNAVNVNFNSLTTGKMFFNLVDLNGKSVYTYSMDDASIGENNLNVVLPKSIDKGIYVVNFFVHNDVMTYKVMVQ